MPYKILYQYSVMHSVFSLTQGSGALVVTLKITMNCNFNTGAQLLINNYLFPICHSSSCHNNFLYDAADDTLHKEIYDTRLMYILAQIYITWH